MQTLKTQKQENQVLILNFNFMKKITFLSLAVIFGLTATT